MIDVADRRKKTGGGRGRLTRTRVKRIAHDGIRRIGRRWRLWLVLGLAAAAVYGAVACGLHAERFRVHEVWVNRCRRVAPETLLELVRLRGRPSIFRVDLDRIRRRLEANPWIAEASVRRSLPDRLVVRVVEHRPVAVVHVGDFYYLDARGRVFKKVERGDPVDFPIVTGLTREDLLRGPDAEEKLAGALELAALAAGRSHFFGGLSEVRVGPLGDFTIVTDGDGLVVRLGRDGFAEKIDRLDLLLGRMGAASRKVARIDMGKDNRAVVRMTASVRGDG